MEYTLHSESETEHLGSCLALGLGPGSVVAFRGDLGAGKTAFVRGLARGLGISQRVTSPTYTIVNEYEGGRLPLFHFDLYRLCSGEELYDIGWEEYLAREGICAVEWSERAQAVLPPETIYVEIRQGDKPDHRRIFIGRAGEEENSDNRKGADCT